MEWNYIKKRDDIFEDLVKFWIHRFNEGIDECYGFFFERDENHAKIILTILNPHTYSKLEIKEKKDRILYLSKNATLNLTSYEWKGEKFTFNMHRKEGDNSSIKYTSLPDNGSLILFKTKDGLQKGNFYDLNSPAPQYYIGKFENNIWTPQFAPMVFLYHSFPTESIEKWVYID